VSAPHSSRLDGFICGPCIELVAEIKRQDEQTRRHEEHH
jgi:hypothetical protein